MASLDDLSRLKRQVDEAHESAARAQGAYDQQLKQLKQEFGVGSIDEAKERLKTLEQELTKLQIQFDKDVAKFKTEYDEVFNDQSQVSP